MTQRDLAGPGVSYAYVSRIEGGHRQPSLKVIRLLAGRLRVSPEYLETGAEAAKERELRLSEAELELRLGRDLDRAEATLRAVAEEGIGDASEARALAALGILAARRGDNAEAIATLEAAARSEHIRPEKRSDVYETLAAAYVAAGDARKAVALLEDCLEAVEEQAGDDATLQVRYRTFLGATFSSIGELSRARRVLAEATERAQGLTIASARVVLYWSLARVAWMQRDSDGALAHMARAIGLLEASDDTLQLARAHLLSGQICNLDNRYEDAARHLDEAERLLVLGADRDDLGILRAEQAKQAAHTGEGERAVRLAREALAELEDDVRHGPTAWHALAIAQAAAGDAEAADVAFARAVDGLSEQRNWRQAAQAAREWAHVVLALGRADDAYALFERAMLLGLRESDVGARG